MNCERELAFAEKLLDNFFVPLTLLNRDTDALSTPWVALRRTLRPLASVLEVYDLLLQQCRPKVIYRYRDDLGCNMLVFRIRGGEDPLFGMVGPYLLHPLTPELLAANAEKFDDPQGILPSLERYYREVPYLTNEHQLLVLLFTLGEYLWGGESATVQDLSLRPAAPISRRTPEQPGSSSGSPLSMEALENRYADEERLIKAVSTGQADQAAIAYSRFSSRQMEQRTTPPLRDMKNYFVVFNTLLRKAAQYGHVHPLYIDQLSSTFAKQIEAAPTTEELLALGPNMVHRYCQLVQDFSMKGHSQLISQLLLHIETDLSSDLSLSAQAKLLNVNSSYLSTLFKKELGTTLTEYVSRRRVDYAMFLLSTTRQPIQAVAQLCGIPDVNYFTRIFKKLTKSTPKEYRSSLGSG